MKACTRMVCSMFTTMQTIKLNNFPWERHNFCNSTFFRLLGEASPLSLQVLFLCAILHQPSHCAFKSSREQHYNCQKIFRMPLVFFHHDNRFHGETCSVIIYTFLKRWLALFYWRKPSYVDAEPFPV